MNCDQIGWLLFSYAHVPWVSKIQKRLEKEGLPAPDEKIKMYEAAYSLMTQNGYEAIGMDHYANAGDELTSSQTKQAASPRTFKAIVHAGQPDRFMPLG